MKTSVAAFLFLSIIATSFSSCEKVIGEGPTITQTRNVTGFRGASISVGKKVNYKIDPVYKVELQAQQNILDIIETYRNGDELVVRLQSGKHINGREDVIINISGPHADFVHLSGACDVHLSGNVTGTNCSLKLSGSGDIYADNVTVTGKISTTISGSGNIKVQNGTADEQALKISGSGSIEMQSVPSNKAVAEISGSGTMWIHVNQTLDATISGSGSVRYRGTPVVSTRVSGSGEVRPF